MNHLLRSLAPISDSGWSLLDEEARQRVQPALGARRLVDFSGPHGWEHSATNLGRTEPLRPVGDGISARVRRVLPLVELRADFELSREELQDADRGADDVDLGPLDAAAREVALAENTAVFHGWANAFRGIGEASPYAREALADTAAGYTHQVAGAVEQLLGNGIAGPYGLALGPDPYRRVVETAEQGGYPLQDHLREILDGPIVWTPGVRGAVVVSLRGGDFVLECGQDLSLGYLSHDAQRVRLYLEESISFHVATPEAAVALGDVRPRARPRATARRRG